MRPTNLLFVYGTLKKGYHNNQYLSKSVFLGRAKTSDKWPLLVNGLPYLMDKKGFGHQVLGDVYNVTDEDVWDRLDRLEGHPQWYQRKVIQVIVGARTSKAWCYLMQNVPQNLKLEDCHHSYDRHPNY